MAPMTCRIMNWWHLSDWHSNSKFSRHHLKIAATIITAILCVTYAIFGWQHLLLVHVLNSNLLTTDINLLPRPYVWYLSLSITSSKLPIFLRIFSHPQVFVLPFLFGLFSLTKSDMINHRRSRTEDEWHSWDKSRGIVWVTKQRKSCCLVKGSHMMMSRVNLVLYPLPVKSLKKSPSSEKKW